MGKLSKKFIVFGLSFAIAITAMATPFAKAVVDPSGCSLTGGAVGITVYRADGTTLVGSGTVTVGETIDYKATLYAIPISFFCSYEGGTWTLTTPDGASHGLGAVTRVGGSGTSTLDSALIPYVVTLGNVSTTPTFHVNATTNYSGGVSNEDVNSETPGPMLGTTDVTQVIAVPTIATTPSAGGLVGTQVSDQATLSGGDSPTGSIAFNLYGANDTNCTGTPIFNDPSETITDGSAQSTGFTSTAPGTYHWTATYSGDTNNASTTSSCSEEAVTITQATPTITTLLSSSTVSAGASVSDSATLVGATPDAGGTVTYTAYTDSACTLGAEPAGDPVTVTSGTVPDSGTLSFSTPGTFYWQASYSGDAKNASTTSNCMDETLTVTKSIPTITTSISDAGGIITSGPTGDSVTDSATVSSVDGGPTPTGSVDFTFYSGATCDSEGTSAGSAIPLNGSGVASPSDSKGPLLTGSYSFMAHYDGDNNYAAADSECEPLTIVQDQPTIATTLSSSTVTVGAAVSDMATLTGATATAGGTVTYTSYTNDTCTTGALVAGPPVTVTDGVVPPSTALTFNTAGIYYWQAAYSGDTENAATTSGCQSEMLSVIKNNPTIGTTPNPTDDNVGATLNDSATLTGAASPTGNITFNLYAPGDTECLATPLFTQSDPVSGASAATTGGFATLADGTYHWTASYPGDGSNSSASSGCEDEPVTISKQNSQTATTIIGVEGGTVVAGTSVQDSATVTGSSTAPSGSVDFTFYNNATCDGDGATAGSVALVGGVASPSTSEGPLTAGVYSFKAHYDGDGNYNVSDSDCEPLSVTTNNSELPTVPNPGTGLIGTTLNDKATLTGVLTPTGSITFNLYNPSDGSCDGPVAYTQTVPVSGNGDYVTTPGFLSAASGTYHWTASYSGDTNNASTTSGCQDEPAIVSLYTPTVTTQLSTSTVALGTAVSDTATLAGASSDAGGSVTYTAYSDSECTANPQLGGTVTVSGGIAPSSNPITFNNAGTFYWQASYTGDGKNSAAKSDCGSETLVVIPVQATVATQVRNAANADITNTSVTADTVIHDHATVTGSSPSGNVTFKLYDNVMCTGDVASSQDVALVSGSADSNTATPGVGTYGYLVSYAGDNNNQGGVAICEPFTITPQPGSISGYKWNDGGVCNSKDGGGNGYGGNGNNGYGGNGISPDGQNEGGNNGGNNGGGNMNCNNPVGKDNGVFDPGESKLSGWTIFIDTNGNGKLDPGETSMVTSATGTYYFPNLDPGTYSVCEVMQNGWSQTYPGGNGCHSVVVGAGQNVTGENFGNMMKGKDITHGDEDKPGTISGVKFNDKNRDMKQDNGEPGIPGWTIQLEKTNGTIIASTVTGAGGTYSFKNVPDGTYIVREVPKAGWKRITKNPAPIVISNGNVVTGISFGNAVKYSYEKNDTYNDDQCNDYGPALHNCTYNSQQNDHNSDCSPSLLP